MTELIKFNQVYQALMEAKTVDEIKEMHDKAEALRLYVKQQGQGLEMQNACAEIKLRAERRAGELLREMERAPAGNARVSPTFQPETQVSEYAAALEEAKISRPTAHRWQTIADLADEVFEEHITKTKVNGRKLTSSGTYKFAKKNIAQTNNQNPKNGKASQKSKLYNI